MAEKNPFARFLSHFPAGKVLFREGDAGEDMYIIQSGRVAIKKRTGAHKDVTLAVLEKGDFFGEMGKRKCRRYSGSFWGCLWMK